MMRAPKVTVLMPVYNGEKYLREAIDSILSQTFSDFEFLIINDGSTDSSLEIIQSYDDSRIRLINNEKNLKLIFTLNKGIGLARSMYIARMDCDDVSLPERLERQVAFMDEYPEIGILGTGIRIIDGNGNRGYTVNPPTDHELISWCLCFYCPIIHPTVMMRREGVVQVGGYSRTMVHAEDYDLWCRISQMTQFSNLKDVLLYLRKHRGSVCETYKTVHLDNSAIVNQNIISNVLREDVDIRLIKSIRNNNFRSSDEHFQAFCLFKKLHQLSMSRKKSSAAINSIRKDAAKRFFGLAIRRIHSLYFLRIIIEAFRLDPLFIMNVLKSYSPHLLRQVQTLGLLFSNYLYQKKILLKIE